MPKTANFAPQQALQRLEATLGRLAARRAFQVAAALAILAFAANSWHRASQTEMRGGVVRLRHSSEFLGFRRIVQAAIVRGEDHYWTIHHIRAYPPFFAIAFAPFGLPPLRLGAAAFVALSLAFGLWAVWLCARCCQPAASVPGRAMLLYLLTAAFIGGAVARCESDMLVLLPIVGAFSLLRRPARARCVGAGALLGFAAALKVTPGLFGLYLLVQRRWAALLAMAATVVLLTLGLGTVVWGYNGTIARHVSWYEVVVRPISRGGPQAPNGRGDGEPIIRRPYRNVNQSLTAALFRFLSGDRRHAGQVEHPGDIYLNVARLSDSTLLALASALKLPILVLLLVAWWRAARSEDWLPNAAAYALVILGCLLLSPVSLHTHHAVLVVPFGICLAAISRGGSGRRPRVVAWAALAAALLMCLTAIELFKALSSLTLADLVLFLAMFFLATGGAPAPLATPFPAPAPQGAAS